MTIQGHISIARDDGTWSMFNNKIMSDHIPAIPHALAGNDRGIITTMGVGTSTSNEDAIDLTEMESKKNKNSVDVYADAKTHGPVINLENSDIDVDSSEFIDNSGAVFISGTLGEGSHQEIDGKEIGEIALFTGNREHMFARTVIPSNKRLFKLRNQSITISWMIFYGVEDTRITRRDWLGDGYGYMYGQNYGQ